MDPSGLAITAVDPIPDFNPLPERNPLGNVIDLPPVADEGYGVYGEAILVGLGEGFYDTFLDAPIKTGQFIIDVPMALNPEYKPMNPHFAAYLNGESGLAGTVFNITFDATSVLPGGPKGPKGPKAPKPPYNPAKGNPIFPAGSSGKPILFGHSSGHLGIKPGSPKGGTFGPSKTGTPSGGVIYVTPGGTSIVAPPNYYATTAINGNGLVLLPNGQKIKNNANIIRYGDPDVKNPKGYIRYYNDKGYALDPKTGNTGSRPDTHFPPDYQGPLIGYPGSK